MARPFSLNIKGRLVSFDKPVIMAIVNLTPDSFYADSRVKGEKEIIARVARVIDEGADIIDIGAVSTRPGASEVGKDEELRRFGSVLGLIREKFPSAIISIDTYRSEVARIAVEDYGADIINDISGGDFDREMFETVARLRVPYVLTHNPLGGSLHIEPSEDVCAIVIKELSEKLRRLSLMGVGDVIIDPGFGFGKTFEQNYELIRKLESFEMLNAPLLVGISRKSMLTKVLNINPEDALEATVALNTISLTRGASILRVHDIKAAAEASKIFMLSLPNS